MIFNPKSVDFSKENYKSVLTDYLEAVFFLKNSVFGVFPGFPKVVIDIETGTSGDGL